MKSLTFVAILFLSVFGSSIAHRRRFYKSVIINSDAGQAVPQALPQVSNVQNVESVGNQQIHKEYVIGPVSEIRKDFGIGFYPQIRKEFVLNSRSNIGSVASVQTESENTVVKEIPNTVLKETVVSHASPTITAPAVPVAPVEHVAPVEPVPHVPTNNNVNVGAGYTNTITKTYSVPHPAPIFSSIFDTVRDVTLRIVNNVADVGSYVAGGGGITKTVSVQKY